MSAPINGNSNSVDQGINGNLIIREDHNDEVAEDTEVE
jgi:hypothetical protein